MLEHEAGVTFVVMNRPEKRNAMSPQLHFDMNDALAAHDAYRRLRQLQHALRLKADKYARVDGRTLAAEIAAVNKLWKAVFGSTT